MCKIKVTYLLSYLLTYLEYTETQPYSQLLKVNYLRDRLRAL